LIEELGAWSKLVFDRETDKRKSVRSRGLGQGFIAL